MFLNNANVKQTFECLPLQQSLPIAEEVLLAEYEAHACYIV